MNKEGPFTLYSRPWHSHNSSPHWILDQKIHLYKTCTLNPRRQEYSEIYHRELHSTSSITITLAKRRQLYLKELPVSLNVLFTRIASKTRMHGFATQAKAMPMKF
jgi:hypothetical protein